MKTLSTNDLAKRVSQELQSPEGTTQEVIDRTIDVMKKELQRGNRIELPEFLTLSVKTGQPVAAKSTSDTTINLPPARLIHLDVDDNFRKKIEGTGLFQILLVVPRKNFFTGVMAARLSSARSEVSLVEGEEAAIEHARKYHPNLIVLDVGLPDPLRVVQEIKKNKETCFSATIRVLGEGESATTFKALSVLSDENIIEPFELGDLVKLAENELSRSAEERNYFEHSVHFKFPSTEEELERADDLVAHLLSQSGLNEEDATKLGVAFHEAADNGCRHGNKSAENKCVEVQYYVDREKVTLSVTDEGDGFDTEIYMSRGVSGNAADAARERHKEGRVGGLGIMLMLKSVDKLEYNYAGNKLTLSKFIAKSGQAAS
jgi:anti-sigma regulatory factor (Ser/Thr protein kinase)/nucleoid DNA-binding protein/ActR/RegA family two-component response regulator